MGMSASVFCQGSEYASDLHYEILLNVTWYYQIQFLFILREKCPNTAFFLVRILPHSDWIQRDTYLSIFSPNTVEYGPEETLYLDTFHVVLYIREPVQFYKKVWKMLFSLPQPNLNFVNPSVSKFFGIFYSFPCGDFPKMHCFCMLGKKYFLILLFWRQTDFGTALY